MYKLVILVFLQMLMNVAVVHMAATSTVATLLVPISAAVIVALFLEMMDDLASVRQHDIIIIII